MFPPLVCKLNEIPDFRKKFICRAGKAMESCMIKLPLLAFGLTIDDKTFGFQLFHVSTFCQLSASYTQNTLAFGF